MYYLQLTYIDDKVIRLYNQHEIKGNHQLGDEWLNNGMINIAIIYHITIPTISSLSSASSSTSLSLSASYHTLSNSVKHNIDALTPISLPVGNNYDVA